MSESSAESSAGSTANAEQPTASPNAEQPSAAAADDDASAPTPAASEGAAEDSESLAEESPAPEEADDAAAEAAAVDEAPVDSVEDEGLEAEDDGDAPADLEEAADVAADADATDGTVPDAQPDAADLELQRYDQLVKEAGQQQLSMIADDTEEDSHLAMDAISNADPAAIPSAPAARMSPSSSSSSSVLTSLNASPSPHAPLNSTFPSPSSLTSSDPSLTAHSALDAARTECEHLLTLNKARQRQIALFLDHQHRHASSTHPSPPHPADDSADPSHPIKTDYIKLLTQIHSLWDELTAKQDKSEATISALIAHLNAQDQRGESLATSLHQFQVEMARTAVDRHGNALSTKALERMQGEERALNKQLADVRLHYLTQQAKVEALQQSIKAKEELAEGLHLIDFEQLKIENATLHEKVEERNDELYKLGKKKNAAVEVLTHVREKVWWVWEENQALRGAVGEEEGDIQDKRREMKALKKVREELRRENEALKVKEGFVGVDALVLDYERRKEALKLVRREVGEREAQYRAIISSTHQGRGRPHTRAEEAKEQVRFNISGAGLTRTLKTRK